MADTNTLDCKIFVETAIDPDGLAKMLAELLSGTVSGRPFARTVQTWCCEIEIRNNPDYDKKLADKFPDGFLSFRYLIEIYPTARADRNERIAVVASILQLLWSRGFPAIAACDYEEELPHKGGVNNRTLPWVSSEQLLRR
jgi:hypothetical protein